MEIRNIFLFVQHVFLQHEEDQGKNGGCSCSIADQ